jgi:putative oxidoreductase
MTGGRNARSVVAVSFGLAVVFFYASIDKLRDPLQFADSVAAFAILPAALISPLALGLPPFEIACGLALLWPPSRRAGALAVALISIVFFTALVSALLRGLTLDCGCFGTGAPSRPRMWLELGLDVLLFLGAVFVYLRSIAPLSARAMNTPAIEA